ncbi:uncharacterized protein BJX67DRAFT_357195 [Aspergillus lucknowensis]|uniref:Uncharacterized protein n=1 Tax=Aspergillus lucknowensis TaxID=176173 RepID=A0ABR4LMV0_9EURO
MTLNVQTTGKHDLMFMGMHDHSFVASVPYQSARNIHLEAENCFGRSEATNSATMDLRSSEAQNPRAGPEAPNMSALSADPYQVHLPDWYSRYTACVEHFLDHAQHSAAVQSLAAYINIRLPFQLLSHPVTGFSSSDSSCSEKGMPSQVSLRCYIRRLVVTGNDTPPILEAFFGSGWEGGVGCICKQERINYLFTAKSNGWASTKAAYDILPDEHTPFLRPLHDTTEQELSMAETQWSEWLAMEDWMVGPRSPWEGGN